MADDNVAQQDIGQSSSSPIVPTLLRDPAILAMSRMMQQQAPGVAPNTSSTGVPAGGGPAAPLDIRSIVSQIASLPQYSGPQAKLEDIYQKERGIQEQIAGQTLPKQGWLDTQGQPQKGGFLHGLMRALTAVGAATGPGQAIQGAVYGPGVRAYNEKQRTLAAQLAALKDEEAIPTEELRGITGLANAGGLAAYRSGELGIQSEKNQIAKQRSDAYAQNVANRHSDELTRLAQGWSRLNQQEQALHLKQWYDQAIIGVMSQRTTAGMDENSARIQAQEDIRAALSQNQWAIQHPIINSIFGSPDLTSAPAAGTPRVMQTPVKPKNTTKPSGKTPAQTQPVGGGTFNWNDHPVVK